MDSFGRSSVGSPKSCDVRVSYFLAVFSRIPRKLSHVQTRGNDLSLKVKAVYLSKSSFAVIGSLCSLDCGDSRSADFNKRVSINRCV